ncbi:acetate transporter [Stemphylium lycopersici]|uniref:Acetate transporter n=1 Tax=Stemphylium lycopersici TaxID=183478 RepID=A0A364MSQ0_STELY|nr:acetate transporter [Stemphylium lycopersici]RAQ99486.1 acetate transporter [Stemphylium lycopersici]RAR02109.1 acetate transporter [Stemphylium lycopersici]
MPTSSTIDLNSKSSANSTDVEKQLTHDAPFVQFAAKKTLGAGWELSVGNGFAYTVFSAFGLFYAGYGAILTPAFGVVAAYRDNLKELNNALGFFMIMYIIIFFCVELGFMLVAASYFAVADGYPAASTALKKGGGAFCFLAGLTGWYLTFALLLMDSIVELPLGDTSKYFAKGRKTE